MFALPLVFCETVCVNISVSSPVLYAIRGVSFGVTYVYTEDIYHITLFSSGEPEAACHAFSTMLCILVGMPVISHLVPNLQLLHLNSASLCCSFVFLKRYTS